MLVAGALPSVAGCGGRAVTGVGEPKAARAFQIGQRVRCRWLARDGWLPGEVTGRSEGRLLVDYDNGEREATAPSYCQLQDGSTPAPADGTGKAKSDAPLKQGERVRCFWGGGATRYPGVVQQVNKGALVIRYDDGDVETLAAFRCVRDAAAGGGAHAAGSASGAQGGAAPAARNTELGEKRLNAMRTFAHYINWLSGVPAKLRVMGEHQERGDEAAWRAAQASFMESLQRGQQLWTRSVDDFKQVEAVACEGAGPWLRKLQANLLIVHEAHAQWREPASMGGDYLQASRAAQRRASEATDAITRAYKFLVRTCP